MQNPSVRSRPVTAARRPSAALAAASILALGLGLGAPAASAQVVLEEEEEEEAAPEPVAPVATTTDDARIGVGLRLRNVRIPEGMLEWFIEDVPGGVSNMGFGAELVRRRGDFEFVFGLEYESLTVPDGKWVEKGKEVMGPYVDDVRDDGFGWITIETSFMYHTPIVPQLALRYGGGAGLAILRGDIRRTDQICTSNDLDSCNEDPNAENRDTPYDLPPVFLVVNAIFGVQIRPTEGLFINIEGGLRTVPFFGTTAGYYF